MTLPFMRDLLEAGVSRAQVKKIMVSLRSILSEASFCRPTSCGGAPPVQAAISDALVWEVIRPHVWVASVIPSTTVLHHRLQFLSMRH